MDKYVEKFHKKFMYGEKFHNRCMHFMLDLWCKRLII